MTRTITWDARLSASKGGQRVSLQLLVECDTLADAKATAVRKCMDDGYDQVSVDWCIEYPPKRKVQRSQAITDD